MMRSPNWCVQKRSRLMYWSRLNEVRDHMLSDEWQDSISTAQFILSRKQTGQTTPNLERWAGRQYARKPQSNPQGSPLWSSFYAAAITVPIHRSNCRLKEMAVSDREGGRKKWQEENLQGKRYQPRCLFALATIYNIQIAQSFRKEWFLSWNM